MKPKLLLLALVAALAYGNETLGEPYTPKSPDEVIGRLTTEISPAAERAFRSLRAQLSGDPQNLGLAVRVAEQLIRRARATSDPRHLSYAEAALQPWWNEPQPPISALVLRATIKQSLHQFVPARADLQQAVQRDPSNVQAWLTLATIDLLQGRYDEARQSCLRLLQRGQEFAAVVVAANIGAMTGHAGPAATRLDALLQSNPEAPADLRRWAFTMSGEIHARLGRFAEAEKAFRAALALDGSEAYLLGAWSDFLLDQRRPDEAIAALTGHESQDALLLRFAEALRQRGSNDDLKKLPGLIAQLDAGFSAGRLRPGFIHQREAARHLLRLKDDPAAALSAALENWNEQKEPVDLRLVLEAAAAAHRPSAAEPVLAFVKAHRYEDVAIRNLAARLGVTTVAAGSKP